VQFTSGVQSFHRKRRGMMKMPQRAADRFLQTVTDDLSAVLAFVGRLFGLKAKWHFIAA
jgi:hypothetical protein